MALSGPFRAADLGNRYAFFAPKPNYGDRARFEDGSLILAGQSNGPAGSSPLAFITGERSYSFTVDLALEDGVQAGLLLFYDDRLFCGVGADRDTLHPYKLGNLQGYPPPGPAVGPKLSLRVVNTRNVASFFIRTAGGGAWRRVVSYEVAGYNHNMADGFMSLRPALFASGQGHARFAFVRFRALPDGS